MFNHFKGLKGPRIRFNKIVVSVFRHLNIHGNAESVQRATNGLQKLVKVEGINAVSLDLDLIVLQPVDTIGRDNPSTLKMLRVYSYEKLAAKARAQGKVNGYWNPRGVYITNVK
jgi:hypothetical protein